MTDFAEVSESDLYLDDNIKRLKKAYTQEGDIQYIIEGWIFFQEVALCRSKKYGIGVLHQRCLLCGRQIVFCIFLVWNFIVFFQKPQ